MRLTSDTVRQTDVDTLPAVSADKQFARLSPRERQVVFGLVEGLSNKAIARKLGLSPRTIEVYRAHMMTKLHARHLMDVLRVAVAAGVLGERAA